MHRGVLICSNSYMDINICFWRINALKLIGRKVTKTHVNREKNKFAGIDVENVHDSSGVCMGIVGSWTTIFSYLKSLKLTRYIS